eukprot:12695584-Heterocapsa_arctica.AAC.1
MVGVRLPVLLAGSLLVLADELVGPSEEAENGAPGACENLPGLGIRPGRADDLPVVEVASWPP